MGISATECGSWGVFERFDKPNELQEFCFCSASTVGETDSFRGNSHASPWSLTQTCCRCLAMLPVLRFDVRNKLTQTVRGE